MITYLIEMFKSIWLQIILGLILFDIFTGIFKAIKFKKLNSSFGIQGLGKHLFFFFTAIFATYVLKVIGLSAWLYPIYLIYTVFYATSIFENAHEAGWKIPRFVLKNLLIYQKAIDEGDLNTVLNVANKISKNSHEETESAKLKELSKESRSIDSEKQDN